MHPAGSGLQAGVVGPTLPSDVRVRKIAPRRPGGLPAWPTSVVSIVVLVTGLLASAGVFVLSRHATRDDERRVLREHAAELKAVLDGTFRSTEAGLRMAAPVGAWDPGGAGAALFQESAGRLIEGDTVAVGVVRQVGTTMQVVASTGVAPPVGSTVQGERLAILQQAASERPPSLVAGLVHDGKDTRLFFARARNGTSIIAFQGSRLRTDWAASQARGSPFAQLRVALYASPREDPARLVVTTDRNLPLAGDAIRTTLSVGSARWLLVVKQRKPLVGSLASSIPWLLLLGGSLGALLAAATVETIIRRRSFALQLVDERTAELTMTRSFLERLLAAGPVLVRRIEAQDRQTTYVSPNSAMVIESSELEGSPSSAAAQRVHPDDVVAVDTAFDRVTSGFSPREALEYRISDGEESFRWVAEVLVPEVDDNDEVSAVLAYMIDVNDRHVAEEGLRVAQNAAESANREKSQFLSRMSHELRTPLNAILGFAQLLEMDDLSPDQIDSVAHIVKGGRHLLALINEVLDISRIEAGEMSLSPEPVLTSTLVGEAVDLMRPMANERGIQIVRATPRVCQQYVYADRQRMKQIMLNLLSNAIKYNRPRGSVAISCEVESDGHLRIDVSDTGPGIPAERLGLLFTPFERLGAEQTSEEGTGIGLALSRRLAEAMGGTISVSSQLGRGTTFAVHLPLTEGPVERYARLTPDDALVPPPSVAPSAVLLHIEDNLSNLTLVERVLAQRPDVGIVAAMHGRLGLELAREHRPAIVLLDLHLPDISGEEVLRSLLSDPSTATTPVVIVSADASPGQAQRLMHAGAAAYLTKPLDVHELLRLVDEATSRE